MSQEYQSATAGEQFFIGESEGAGEFSRRRRWRRLRRRIPRMFRRRRRYPFSNPNYGAGVFGGGWDYPEPPEPPDPGDEGQSEFRARGLPSRIGLSRPVFRSAAYRRPLVRRFGPVFRSRVAFRPGIHPGIWRGRYPYRSVVRPGVWAGRYPYRPGFRPGVWAGRYVYPGNWRGRYGYPWGYRSGIWPGRYPYQPGRPYPIWPGLLTVPPPPPYPIVPPEGLPAPATPVAPPAAVFDPSLMPPPETPAAPPPPPSGDDNTDAAAGGDASAAPGADAQPPENAPPSEFYFEYGGPGAPTFTPVPVEHPGGGRIADRRAPNRSEVVQVRGVGRNHIPVHRLAAAALEALIAAARADGIGEPLLRPVSGFRDPARQTQLWQQALQRYGSPQVARSWVAPPGSSAHQTGRAIDFHLGGPNSSDRVAQLRTLPAYQWLVRNAARFGFYPYANEPWHWEYNPPANGHRRGAY